VRPSVAIATFDARVDRAVQAIRTPVLDRCVYTLSSAADHSLLWFAIGAARSARRGDVGFAARFSAAMGLESGLTNGPVKAVFRRGRPVLELVGGPLPFGMRRPITSSFPSGHATAAFTAAMLLAERRRAPWLVLAGLVGGSRVYVQMHHASDVIGGAILGIVLGAALRPVVRRDRS